MDPVILKRRHVTREDSTARRIQAAVDSGQCAAPTVRTLMVDGLAHALEVTCACGEKITVELQTDARPAQDTARIKE